MRRAVFPLLLSLATWLSLSATAPVSAAASCGGPNPSQLRMSSTDLSNPSPSVICRARLALQGHAVLTATGTTSSVGQLGRVLGISMPEASVNQPVSSALLGAHVDSKGLLQVYEGLAAPGMAAPAAAGLSQWASTQIAAQATALASQPTDAAWTALASGQMSYIDSQGSSVTFSMSDFRLNDINSGGDWYLFASQLQTVPKYQGCDFNTCGPYVINRHVNEPGASPLALTDYGKTSTSTGSTVGWTVGTSLSVGTSDVGVGVNSSYSQSWDQPSVVTTDTSSFPGNNAGWYESFSGPDFSHYPNAVPPPVTATGTFVSEQASIFEVPEGTTSASLTSYGGYETETDTWTSYTCYYFFTCLSESSHYIGVEVSVRMTPQPPVLSASPSSQSLTGGSSGTISIQALVPGSTQGLTWDITNIPSWLTVSQLSGSTSATITVSVQPKTRNQVAYLNIQTSPAYAAPSVERGPLVVTITVPKH